MLQLSSQCGVYSNIDASGLNISALNPNPAPLYSPKPSSVPNLVDKAQCKTGPCLNLCCNVNPDTGSCLDNLVSNGGFYLPGNLPGLASFFASVAHFVPCREVLSAEPVQRPPAKQMHKCFSYRLHNSISLQGCRKVY